MREELNNFEGEETPEQAKVSEELRKMAAENNDAQEPKKEAGDKRTTRRGFLRSALRGAAAIAVTGRVTEAFAGSEKKESDREKEDRKKNVQFLKGIFQRISGGGIGKDQKSGDLIIHIGDGKYNELKNAELGELTKEVGPHREYIEAMTKKMAEAKKPEDKQKYGKIIEKANVLAIASTRNEIIKTNHSVKLESLPQNLKDFEEKRQKEEEEKKKVREEMSEGSIIQPINPDTKNK